MCAAPDLTHSLARTHQFLTFTTPPNLQAAVAWGLENAEDWFRQMPLDLERSRDRLKGDRPEAPKGSLCWPRRAPTS